MWDRAEPASSRDIETTGEQLGRVLGFGTTEPKAHDATLPVFDGEGHDLLYRDRIGVAGDVGRQPDLDAQLLAGLLRAVAVAGEQLVGIEPQ